MFLSEQEVQLLFSLAGTTSRMLFAADGAKLLGHQQLVKCGVGSSGYVSRLRVKLRKKCQGEMWWSLGSHHGRFSDACPNDQAEPVTKTTSEVVG